MQLRTFSLPVDHEGVLDDSEMREALDGCEVLQVWERFLELERVWLIMIGYRIITSRREREASSGKNTRIRKRDQLMNGLDPFEREIFERFRVWRRRIATERQIGPHFVLTNAQLVEIVKRRPQNLSELGEVKGIGDGKLKQFGESLLEVSEQAWRQHTQAPKNKEET